MIGPKCEMSTANHKLINVDNNVWKIQVPELCNVICYVCYVYWSHILVGNPDIESRTAKSWITQAEGFQREFTRMRSRGSIKLRGGKLFANIQDLPKGCITTV